MRTSASRVPAYVIFDNLRKQFVPLDKTFGHNVLKAPRKYLKSYVPKDFFGGGGGGGRDIERNQWPGSSDIDGQDQCEHMLNLVTVIAIFLSA